MTRLTPKASQAMRAIVAFQHDTGRRPTAAELGAAMDPPIKLERARHYIYLLHYLGIFQGRMACATQAVCAEARKPRCGTWPWPLTMRGQKLAKTNPQTTERET